MLQVGDKAPDFSGIDQHEKEVKLSDFKGKKLVLYFYPKDNTPGCTMEAKNLRDNYELLLSKGYEVVGVSADSITRHKKFAEKYNLPFSLIADEDKTILRAYDAWGLKKFMGREYEGIIRKTYVINEDGIIEKIIDKVKTKAHAEQILEIK